MEPSRQFVRNLARARQAVGWSQAELSRRLKEQGLDNFHATTVARVEKGDRQVRLDEAPTIAACFAATVEQMMLPADNFEKVLVWVQLHTERWRCINALRAAADAYDSNRDAIRAFLAQDEMELLKARLGDQELAGMRHAVDDPPETYAGSDRIRY